MKTLNSILTLILLIVITSDNFCSTVTWLGGNGDWEDSSQWDTGEVPDTDDIAVINSGIVTIEVYGNANSIILEGGELHVDGRLVIQPTIANAQNNFHGLDIHQHASYINNGLTVINQIVPLSGQARLIYNNGTLINNADGYIFMQGEDFTGIHNYTFASCTNYGEIYIKNVGTGIFSVSDFFNYGDIDIISSSFSVTTQKLFYNSSNATLSTNNIISINTPAFLNNYGEININFENTFQGTALSVGGKVTLQRHSNITIEGEFVDAIYLHEDSEMRVKGTLQATSVSPYSSGLFLVGFFVNHQTGNITFNTGVGVTTFINTSCLNYGNWVINDASNGASRSLRIYGSFNNRPKGKLTLQNKIVTENGSTLNNQGHMFANYSEDEHEISGTFNNTACLNDLYGNLSSSVNNSSIIVEPLNVSPQVNVPITNALNLGSNLGASVLTWYTTATGSTVAGSYNSNTNTFTPNNNAIGLSSLFVRTRINAGGVTRRHEIQFDDPIQALTSILNNKLMNTKTFKTSIITYPNPATDYIRVSTQAQEIEIGTIKLYDLKGQEVTSRKCDDLTNCEIDLPINIGNGLYHLNIYNKKGIHFKTEMVKVFR